MCIRDRLEEWQFGDCSSDNNKWTQRHQPKPWNSWSGPKLREGEPLATIQSWINKFRWRISFFSYYALFPQYWEDGTCIAGLLMERWAIWCPDAFPDDNQWCLCRGSNLQPLDGKASPLPLHHGRPHQCTCIFLGYLISHQFLTVRFKEELLKMLLFDRAPHMKKK